MKTDLPIDAIPQPGDLVRSHEFHGLMLGYGKSYAPSKDYNYKLAEVLWQAGHVNLCWVGQLRVVAKGNKAQQ